MTINTIRPLQGLFYNLLAVRRYNKNKTNDHSIVKRYPITLTLLRRTLKTGNHCDNT